MLFSVHYQFYFRTEEVLLLLHFFSIIAVDEQVNIASRGPWANTSSCAHMYNSHRHCIQQTSTLRLFELGPLWEKLFHCGLDSTTILYNSICQERVAEEEEGHDKHSIKNLHECTASVHKKISHSTENLQPCAAFCSERRRYGAKPMWHMIGL